MELAIQKYLRKFGFDKSVFARREICSRYY